MSQLAERLIAEITQAFYKDRDNITGIMVQHGGGHTGEVWDRGDANLFVTYSFSSKASAMKAFAAARGKYPWIKQDSMKPAKAFYSDPPGTQRVNLRVVIPTDSYT